MVGGTSHSSIHVDKLRFERRIQTSKQGGLSPLSGSNVLADLYMTTKMQTYCISISSLMFAYHNNNVSPAFTNSFIVVSIVSLL